MKYYFSILLFAFIGLVSSSRNNDTFPSDIAQVSGLLYEKQANQDIMLIFPQTNINPSSIKHIIIKKERNYDTYPLNLVCDYKKELYPNSFVKCKIDLSKVPQGFYKIIILIYDTEHYRVNNLLPFLVIGEEQPERPIELIDTIENIIEYSRNQEIRFLFSKNEINPQLINSMIISNNRYNQYNISLYCPYRLNMTWIKCYGDFSKIGANKYLIQRIDYTIANAYPSRDIYIQIQNKQDEDLKLISIRGNAFKGNTTLSLTFNKNVVGNQFSYFYLYNRTNFYNLTNTIVTKYDNKSEISVNFDFTYIPIGPYHLGTRYKGNAYEFSNLYINITNNNCINYKWNLSNIIYSFIGGISKKRSNLRMPKN